MALRAYVLHLLRATARRENARSLLRSCGVPGDIWPAVDGAAMDHADLWADYRPALFAPLYPFDLRAGEVGCFLSHRQIWADLQTRSEDAALILEDDAGLNPDAFAPALALAENHVERLGLIQLQTRPPKGPARLIDKSGASALVMPRVPGLRTTGQVISRWAAAELLAQSTPFDRPVDTFLQSYWRTGIKPAVIHPSGLSEIADRLDGSTIQSARKSIGERIWREWQRARYRMAVARLSRRTPAPAFDDG